MITNKENIRENYYSKWRGKDIKGTTVILNDDDGIPIAAVCVNLDLTMIRENSADVIGQITRTVRTYDDSFPSTDEEAATFIIESETSPEKRKRHGERLLDYLCNETYLFRLNCREHIVSELAKSMGISFPEYP